MRIQNERRGRLHHRGRSVPGGGCLLDQENDTAFRALSYLDLVAGFTDQIGDVDHRERIGAVNFQEIARRDRLQRLARFKCRQGAFETGKIELCRVHTCEHGEARTQRQHSVFERSRTGQ